MEGNKKIYLVTVKVTYIKNQRDTLIIVVLKYHFVVRITNS